MNKRELMLCALNHKENIIPLWPMAFENIETAKRLIGDENVPGDLCPLTYYRGSTSLENMYRNIAFAEKIDSFVIGVGRGGNFAFGHGGPGEFMERIVESGENYRISVYETGVKKEVRSNPYFYRHFDYPAESEKDFDAMGFPNAKDPSRYNGIDEEIKFYKENGYFTCASINGFFSGLHYFLCPYDKILAYMLLEPDFVGKMLMKLGEFNLTAAEELLRRGVDCITFCDDLGSGSSLLFSPELYEKFFFPWHKELADLCHSYGAYVHMHSHGNINKIIKSIVDTGVDMLNPCDPYEGMEIAKLKREFGDKVTFVGGLDKFFFQWDEERMKESLTQLIETGRQSGGYIFMDSSGGITEDVSKEKYDYFMKLSKELRYRVKP